jgi:hypothetical protein
MDLLDEPHGVMGANGREIEDKNDSGDVKEQMAEVTFELKETGRHP